MGFCPRDLGKERKDKIYHCISLQAIPHDGSELLGGDGAVSILVKQREGFFELGNLVFSQLFGHLVGNSGAVKIDWRNFTSERQKLTVVRPRVRLRLGVQVTYGRDGGLADHAIKDILFSRIAKISSSRALSYRFLKEKLGGGLYESTYTDTVVQIYYFILTYFYMTANDIDTYRRPLPLSFRN